MPEVDVAATRMAASHLDSQAVHLRATCNGDGSARTSDELGPVSGSVTFAASEDLETGLCGRLEGAATEFDALVAGLRQLADNVEKATG